MDTEMERRTMASRSEHQRINPKHQSGHYIPKESIRYDGHGGRGSHSDGDLDIPPKWSGREKMICTQVKVTPPKKDYDIHPYAEVDVKVEVESVEDGKKIAICAEVDMMTLGFYGGEPSRPAMIPSQVDLTFDLKGDLKGVGRPIMEPNKTPTVHNISHSSTKSGALPADIRRAAIGFARTTGASTSKPTFTWTSAPFDKHDSTSAVFNFSVETYDDGSRIVLGDYKLGSMPKLPLQGHGYTPLFESGSSLCRARWICALPTNPKTVELGLEVKLRPTIFERHCLFYSVTKGGIFTYKKNFIFTRPEFGRDFRAL